MFTGIVQGTAKIVGADRGQGLVTLRVAIPDDLQDGITLGASIALDGVCLTVTTYEGGVSTFDVMDETLQKTTLRNLAAGSLVNIERSAKFADEIGGHLLSGHVAGTAQVVRIETPPNNYYVRFALDAALLKYVFPKGFIAIDGVSLTVIDVDRQEGVFSVGLIPETLRRTVLGARSVGKSVNIEIDSQTRATVDTVERVLAEKSGG